MIEGGEARIVPSAVYDVNLQQFQQQASSADALCFYLKPSKNVQSEDAGIVSKADEITAGIAGCLRQGAGDSRLGGLLSLF